MQAACLWQRHAHAVPGNLELPNGLDLSNNGAAQWFLVCSIIVHCKIFGSARSTAAGDWV